MSKAAPHSELFEPTAVVESPGKSEPVPSFTRNLPPPGRQIRTDPGVTLRLGTSVPGATSRQRVDERQTSADLLTGGDSFEHFVARYGQAYDSYLATEPGRWIFWSRQRLGLISYYRSGRCLVVGGGLIAPEEHKETLLREFVEQTRQHNLRASFFNINEEDLPLFRKLGFRVTKWGEEPVIDLATLTWGGKSYEWVRRQSNYCLRHDVRAAEVRKQDLDPEEWNRTMAEVRDVAAESLSQKSHPQGMTFMEGRIDNHELGLRRLFVARSDQGRGRIEGFVICNPLRNGRMWSTELYRHRIDSVRGTMAFLFHHLIEQMRVEGVERVQLCVDPGLNCSTPMPNDAPVIRRTLGLRPYFGFVFDFAGVHHFRSRFRPYYVNRYVCAQPGAPVGLTWAFAKATGCFQFHYWNMFLSCLDRIRKRVSRKTLVGTD